MTDQLNRYATVIVAAKESRRLNAIKLSTREVHETEEDSDVFVPIAPPAEPEEKVTVMSLRRLAEGRIEPVSEEEEPSEE